MFKFLLILFVFSPDGSVGMVKTPTPTYEACQQLGANLTAKINAAGGAAVGTCVKPGDYIADA